MTDPVTTPTSPSPRTRAMRRGRQNDSTRRRQRVIAALDKAITDGIELSVSGIARAAGVDRSFLYRHRDLLAQLHALEAQPPADVVRHAPSDLTVGSVDACRLATGVDDHAVAT